MIENKNTIAKDVLLDELEENNHPERVEDVIFWALEFYAQNKGDTTGAMVAYAIKERIIEAEASFPTSNTLKEAMKKEEIYLDLSKLSETERKEVYLLTILEYDDYYNCLFYNSDYNHFDCVVECTHEYLKNKQEITYEQLKELMK